MKKIIVSACLLGCNCKYSGGNNRNEKLIQLKDRYHLIPICPEVDGGLPTPRPPCEIVKDKVRTKDGRDYTSYFQKGAKLSLATAKKEGATLAILKSRSPSCGYGQIYDGSFSGKLIAGKGLTAELLEQNGIKIYNEDNFDEKL